MSTRQLDRIIDQIRRRDGRRFETAVLERLRTMSLNTELAPAIADALCHHINSIPHMLVVMKSWARQADVGGEVEPQLEWAERYVRRHDDELDAQKAGLFGLLDDFWIVGSLMGRCRDAGLVVPDGIDLDQSIDLSALLLGTDIVERLTARLDAAIASGPLQADAASHSVDRAPEPPPEPDPEPVLTLDGRLIGTWHHTSYHSEDDFSFSTSTSRFFGSDGRYVEGSQSFVSSVHRNSRGGVIGHGAGAGAPSHARGQWSVEDDRLILDADDGRRSVHRMEVYPDSLLLTRQGHDPLLWKR